MCPALSISRVVQTPLFYSPIPFPCPNLNLIRPCLRYSDIQWASTSLTLRSMFDLSPGSPGGRFLVLGAAFAAVIIACMYIASYSASQVGAYAWLLAGSVRT